MGAGAMILLAVDPGLRFPGAALFDDAKLVAAAAIKVPPSFQALPKPRRAALVAGTIHAFAAAEYICNPHRIALEWPQFYRAGKSKGDPNDLFGLAGVCAAVVALYPTADVSAYLPGDWCRLPKVTSHADAFTSIRGSRIMSRLSDAERALVPMSHDAVDAVGIGLHALHRLAPRRVYPGATPG